MLGFQRFILPLVFLMIIKTNAQSTASQQVSSFSIQDPKSNEERQIWVYLPKNYEDSEKHYPVLYMFDGQNIFDNETSYAGEWQIDEYLDLNNEEQIVVAIAHGNEKRINELTPFKNEQYGGGEGNQFLEFILLTLKPHIDKNYRTFIDSSHTSIAGASLGGLMAYYTLIKHPDIFSKAIALSPSFWINPEILELTQKTEIPDSSKFYIVTGSDEGDLMTTSYETMLEGLISKGLYHEQFYMELVEGGKHNEHFWKEQFKSAYSKFYLNSK